MVGPWAIRQLVPTAMITADRARAITSIKLRSPCLGHLLGSRVSIGGRVGIRVGT